MLSQEEQNALIYFKQRFHEYIGVQGYIFSDEELLTIINGLKEYPKETWSRGLLQKVAKEKVPTAFLVAAEPLSQTDINFILDNLLELLGKK